MAACCAPHTTRQAPGPQGSPSPHPTRTRTQEKLARQASSSTQGVLNAGTRKGGMRKAHPTRV